MPTAFTDFAEALSPLALFSEADHTLLLQSRGSTGKRDAPFACTQKVYRHLRLRSITLAPTAHQLLSSVNAANALALGGKECLCRFHDDFMFTG